MKKSPLILVVREFDKFSSLLMENNLEVINFPAIQTLSLEDSSAIAEKIRNIKSYDGLFLTSPKAAEIFLQNVENEQNNFHGKIYILGNRTKSLFENTNFEIVYCAATNTAEEFINSFERSEFEGKRFLFLKGSKSLRTIPNLLKDLALVEELIVYQTVEKPPNENLKNEISEKLTSSEIDWICFLSPSGIEYFVKIFSKCLPNNAKIAAIGATTATAAAANNFEVAFVSPTTDATNFASELLNFIKNIE